VRDPSRVVVRNNPALRFGGSILIGIFALNFWWEIISSIRTGNPGWAAGRDDLGPGSLALLWTIIGIGFLITNALVLFCLMFKETFDADGVAVRQFLTTRRLALGDMRSVEIRGAILHTGQVQVPFKRLVVQGDLKQIRTRAILQAGFPNAVAALGVVDQWVRTRPEMVSGTAAEEFFVSRGIVQPAPSTDDPGAE
jgi:hypothetical protein